MIFVIAANAKVIFLQYVRCNFDYFLKSEVSPARDGGQGKHSRAKNPFEIRIFNLGTRTTQCVNMNMECLLKYRR